MNNIEELYETIFCSQYGAENRGELLEKHKDLLPELEKEHKKSGMKINGIAIPFVAVINNDFSKETCEKYQDKIPIDDFKYNFELWQKLKDFYAQPLDGCWPLRPCWVPDLEKPPRHVKSRQVSEIPVTSFRRFTFEEFLQILEMRKVKQ